MRPSVFNSLAISLAFVIRIFASLGRPIARFPDSLGYETFRLFGSIDRFWPIPFLYSFVQSDTGRIALHVAFGSVAWTWCAHVLSKMSRYSRATLAAVLLLGLSPQIVRYDLAILSESLGISFMVLAVAASINVQQKRTPSSVTIWIVSISLCATTRPVHLWILFVALIPPMWALITSRGRRMTTSTAILLIVLLAGFLQMRENSNTSALNLYTVLQDRVITDDARFQWFSDNGMPISNGMRQATGYDYSGQIPDEVTNIIALPQGQQPPSLMRVGGTPLAQWVKNHGWQAYSRYVVTHPQDSLSRLTSLTNATLSPPNDDFLPLDSGPMIPRVLYGSWELWGMLGLCATFFVFLKSRKNFALLVGLTVSGAGVYAISMLTSGIEHPRHAVTSAAALRLIALVALVFAMPRAMQKAKLDAPDDEPA